jgi:hypothetical protein
LTYTHREYRIVEEVDRLEVTIDGETTYRKSQPRFVIYCVPRGWIRIWKWWPYHLAEHTPLVYPCYPTKWEAAKALKSYLRDRFPLDAGPPRM